MKNVKGLLSVSKIYITLILLYYYFISVWLYNLHAVYDLCFSIGFKMRFFDNKIIFGVNFLVYR